MPGIVLKVTVRIVALVAALLSSAVLASAQQVTGTPGSPSATTTVDGRYLPNPPASFGGEIGLSSKDSKPYWQPNIVPPKGAPNILLIMTDDAGYGVSSTFGGVIPTPTLDQVAADGLRYTQFHSTALCSPTRAALITGRNHHSVGAGVVLEQATGYPGYDGVIGVDNGTIGEILRQNGYATSWFGKNHNTPSYQYSDAGPFDQWPIGMGFEYFYGFMGGEADQHRPFLFRNTNQIAPWEQNPDFNLITGMADDAVDHLKKLNAQAPEKPFFVYYVPGASHAPHQPTQEWVDKIHAMHLFDGGWNKLRETIFANQQRLGVVPKDTQLTPWPQDLLKNWDQLTADEQKLFIRQAEVFAAYVAYTDHEIGRVIQAVKDMGKLDNTLIIYIEGDNGTSSEGTPNGTPFDLAALQGIPIPVADQMKFYDAWGTAATQPHMAVGWAWAFDTPFKWVKQVASHFGGTRQGMAISWPGHIADLGGIRPQFHHMIDIVPTILEVTGIPAPQMLNGVAQKPIEGISMAYTFDKANANAPSKRDTQYFEIFGNRAIYHDGWLAATTPPEGPWFMGTKAMPDVLSYKWELYNIAKDYSENNDLAGQMPDKLKEMQERFLIQAEKYGVLPLDNSVLPRVLSPKPSYVAGRDFFVYSAELSGIASSNAPNILARDFTITADVEVPADGSGMIVTNGGKFGGFGFYLVSGKPIFTYNLLSLAKFRWEGATALAAGKHTIAFDFKYDGPGIGKGGTGTLTVDGQQVATQQIPHTIPAIMSLDETFDLGVDTRTGVNDSDYQVPFKFNGTLEKVSVKLGPSQMQ
ncbi:arylsulfatase [Rhizobium binae]|uniref:Arylsulfatase n=2 Tax=Rhizobium binae TaxID=1138190 RepID=A0ABV2MFY7_9HYPH|nr:arylsulfatase [Rhizobium binae]MBX4994668.1 arylsulfatase [Rhizobium binae]NKL49930.1 sulfatase-like hydrolase/transferase [Rhizobium leguminosarum bv. viciae]QSY85414.1 arylsulfatase [Rhizobium binae]